MTIHIRHGEPRAAPEATLVAAGATEVLVGFAELSRREYAEGCAEAWARDLGCSEFASDTQVENTASAAAHRALGFEEVEVIRCFRKALR